MPGGRFSRPGDHSGPISGHFRRSRARPPICDLNIVTLPQLRQDRCLLLRQDRCLLLRQDRCLLLRQDRCLLLRQDRCKMVRQGSALSYQWTSVLSQQKASVLSQQQTSVLSQQQTSVLSQQKTSILSQQQTFGPEPAELWPGIRGTLKLKVGSGLPVGASPTRAVARMTAVQQTPSN